jgi:uncharacterized protein
VVGISLFFLSSLLVLLAVVAAGRDFIIQDPEDIFAIAGQIAEYADERLQAATRGEALPDPPRIYADEGALRIALGFTVLFQVVTIGAVLLITGRSPGELIQVFRMDQFRTRHLLRPAVATIVAYAGVITYAVVVEALGWDVLVPDSTIPAAVTRDAIALILTGLAAVILAPLSEELLYRGLIMGGLLKWGFLPAAVISSAVFAGVHLDVGSLIPFFGVGMVLAWLFWSGGRLWDAVLFHFFFNGISYLILVSMGGQV